MISIMRVILATTAGIEESVISRWSCNLHARVCADPSTREPAARPDPRNKSSKHGRSPEVRNSKTPPVIVLKMAAALSRQLFHVLLRGEMGDSVSLKLLV